MNNLVTIDQDLYFDNIAFIFRNGVWKIYQDNIVKKEEFRYILRIDESNRFFIAKNANDSGFSLLDYEYTLYCYKYRAIKYYRIDRILVQMDYGRWYFISLQNSEMNYRQISDDFDDIIEREDGLFEVKKNNLWGVIDLDCRVIVPISYLLPFSSSKLDSLSFWNLYGLRTPNGTKNGLLGLYRYNNGLIKNLIPPIYTDIFVPYRRTNQYYSTVDRLMRKRQPCGFIFGIRCDDCSLTCPDPEDGGMIATERGFIDLYNWNGEKLFCHYLCYDITYDGKYLFAGRNGEIIWDGYDDPTSFDSFEGVFDMINNEGEIIVKDINRYYYCEASTSEGHNISLLNINIGAYDIWIILKEDNTIIKSGLAPLHISYPINADGSFLKKLQQYAIEFERKELIAYFKGFGFTPEDISFELERIDRNEQTFCNED